jgi:hypothetical protein
VRSERSFIFKVHDLKGFLALPKTEIENDIKRTNVGIAPGVRQSGLGYLGNHDLHHEEEEAGQFPGVCVSKPDEMGPGYFYLGHSDLRHDREELEQRLRIHHSMQSAMASGCPCLVNLHLRRPR